MSNRLMAEGFSREQALELIACIVVAEIFEVMYSGQPYNEDRYLAGLRRLPTMPEDRDE